MTQQMSAIGQIATDPKLFTPTGGAEYCTFRFASAERRFDPARAEWVDTEPNWFTVNAFRSLAVHAQQSFRKGDRIVVTGKLRVRAWEAEEKRGISVEIDAEGIGHDVRWGVSAFTKQPVTVQSAPPPSGEAAPISQPPDDSPAEAPVGTDGFIPEPTGVG